MLLHRSSLTAKTGTADTSQRPFAKTSALTENSANSFGKDSRRAPLIKKDKSKKDKIVLAIKKEKVHLLLCHDHFRSHALNSARCPVRTDESDSVKSS